jgi:hypothetical protein
MGGEWEVRREIAARDLRLASPFAAIFFPEPGRRVARAPIPPYDHAMKNLLSALSAGLLFASCAPSTPQARIQQQPEKFQALSAKHQALVQQGRVDRGMSQDAVFLAWGAPSRTFQGSRNNQLSERWDYSGSRPVRIDTFHGSYGRFGGPCGSRGFGSVGWGPEVAFIPYRIGSVWFIYNQVEAWERAR